MSIVKDQKINVTDLQSVINAVNTELGRRVIGSPILPPAPQDKIDDTQLDTLAAKILEIRDFHCYCQSNSSMVHSGCPAYIAPTLQSSGVDPDAKITASNPSGPDVLDITADLSKLVGTIPCQPECSCNDYCVCHGVSNLAVVCPSQCNCNKVCNCQTACDCDGDCSCDGFTTCSCENECSCDDNTCMCEGFCGCNAFCDCAAAVQT